MYTSKLLTPDGTWDAEDIQEGLFLLSHCMSSLLRSREIGELADSLINLSAGFV